MQQLDLLTYVPTAQEMAAAHDIAPEQPVSLSAIYWQSCARVYLALMGSIAKGDRLPQDVKRHEIGRLMAMREHALQRARGEQCS